MSKTSKVFNNVVIKYKNESNLSVDLLLVVLGVFMATLIIIGPQIYIKNTIYYKSININKLYKDYQALLSTNKRLHWQFQAKRFKHEHLMLNNSKTKAKP